MKIIKIKIGNRTLRIKDCKGIASLKGLMFDSMKNCDGALIYGKVIWMPFIKHKLKLIFLDKDFEVVDTQYAIPISINIKSWRTYSCSRAKYCLETNKDVKVKIGDKIRSI